jgi:hypothetical protein
VSDKNIPYWRDLSFKSLEKFCKELKTDPDLILLAEYTELKGKGLRKQAHKKLNEFIVSALRFEETKNRSLVKLICQKKLEWGFTADLFDSYPLTNQVIVPTLKQWVADEPQNPEPLKWLGLFYYGNENYSEHDSGYFTALEQSLALNPKDNVVRKALIQRYLDCIDYSTHHLMSDSGYIGDPSEDLEMCTTIEAHLKNLQDKDAQVTLTRELNKYRHMIQNYQRYVSVDVKMSFAEWCLTKSPL